MKIWGWSGDPSAKAWYLFVISVHKKTIIRRDPINGEVFLHPKIAGRWFDGFSRAKQELIKELQRQECASKRAYRRAIKNVRAFKKTDAEGG